MVLERSGALSLTTARRLSVFMACASVVPWWLVMQLGRLDIMAESDAVRVLEGAVSSRYVAALMSVRGKSSPLNSSGCATDFARA